MGILKSLFKSTRAWHNYSAVAILTVVVTIFYIAQVTYLSSFISMRYGNKNEEAHRSRDEEYSFFPNFKFEGEQIVHIDLKGAPPKISYILELLPFLKELGASGILMEYEDMFPYKGELEEISAKNAYTPSEIAAIVKSAEQNNLTIIPLVPTFSQFDFVLKLQRFKDFREIEDYPHVICPSQRNIYPLLYKMIDQILEAHPRSRYLHIGNDESHFVGMCTKCQLLMKKKKWRKDDIYYSHIKKLAKYINATYAGVRPIIWGEKLLKQNQKIILSNQLPQFVDIMLWNFRSEKNFFPRDDDMNTYARLFKSIWIASAYKGATGSTVIITDPDYYLQNMRTWMYFVREWKRKIIFKGIALVGWQRRNHFSLLNELLPVGMPSLALSMQYLNKKKGSDYDEVKQALSCNDLVPMNFAEMRDQAVLSRLRCDYPGFRIYQLVNLFHIAVDDLETLLGKLDPGDLSFYSITHNTSNPSYVHKPSLNIYKKYLNKINRMESDIKMALTEVYDRYTVDEWINTYVLPQRLRLEAIVNTISRLRSSKVWPRRPFPDISPQIQQFFNKTCGQRETLGCALFNFL